MEKVDKVIVQLDNSNLTSGLNELDSKGTQI